MNRRALLYPLALAACVAAIGGCAHATAPSGPRAEIAQADGDVVVANSRDGQAIFEARDLAPGQSRSGQVELTNSGRLAGALELVQSGVQDQPGPGGGRLSDRVDLSIRDVTDPAGPVTVFAGPLARLADLRLGTLDPGATRRYAFTVHLPDGGRPPGPQAGDNAYLGSVLTVRYAWRATAPDDPPPPPAGPVAPSGAPRVSFKVRSRKLLKRGYIDVVARCSQACRLTARAREVTRKRRKLRTRPRTVSISDPAKARRVRLKLSRKDRRQVAKRRRLVLAVSVTAQATSGGPTASASRKLTVRRKRR
jgi:hypothetical protein